MEAKCPRESPDGRKLKPDDRDRYRRKIRLQRGDRPPKTVAPRRHTPTAETGAISYVQYKERAEERRSFRVSELGM